MLQQMDLRFQSQDDLKFKNQNYSIFDALLPDKKRWYSVKEAATVLGLSEQCVRNCFDNQKILGHVWNGKAVAGQEQRQSYHIPRRSIVLFLMETANYNAKDLLGRFDAIERAFAH